MPAITEHFVDSASPGRHYEETLPGSGLDVGTTCARNYFFEFRPGRSRTVAKRTISLGKQGEPKTSERARQRAQQALAELQAGGDPLEARKAIEDRKSMGVALDEWPSGISTGVVPSRELALSSGWRFSCTDLRSPTTS